MRATSPAMIGRDDAMASLMRQFDQAVAGEPRIAIVGGEAGIGKSRLIEEFRDRLPTDAVLVTGQCVEHGTVGLPYAPLAGIIRGLTDAFGREAIEAIAGDRLLPRTLAEPAAHERDERTGVDRLDEVVTTLWERLSADRPLVVVVEDLHWADPATLDVLRFAARQLWSGRLLIVLTYRTDDVGRGHPLRPFLAELERSRRVSRIALERLSPAQVREQASAILGSVPSAAQATLLIERSEGVPFFVEELLCTVIPGQGTVVPDTLRELLLTRYELLGDDARQAVRVLAAGGSVSHEVLTDVSPLDPERLDDALREAIEAGVIVVVGRRYDFRHALVREAVHDELLPGESTRFHTAYARALEQRETETTRTAGRAVLISFHWMEAHDQEHAFVTALDAMQLSRAAFAHAGAAQMGERALSLWESIPDAEQKAGMTHVDLLEKTALAWRSAGEAQRAMSTIELALSEAIDAEPGVRAKLLRDKGLMLSVDMRADAVVSLEAALALVADGSDPMLRANILAEIASHYMINGRTDEAIAATTEVLDSGDPSWVRSLSIAANIRGGTLLHSGRVDEGLADMARAKQYAGADRDPLLRYYVNLSDSYHLLGRFEDSLSTATEGLQMAREAGVERTSGAILAVNTIDPLFSLGRWREADELIDRSLELDPPAVFRVYLRRAKIRSLVWSGDPARARELWEPWATSMSTLGEFESQTRAGVALDISDLMMAIGDVDAAWAFAGTILDDGRLASAGWELPLAGAAAHVLAARRVAHAEPDAARLFDDDERRLWQVLERDAVWPTHRFWHLLVTAELSGGSGTGTDVHAWLDVHEAATASEVSVLARLQVDLGLAKAQIASGDRVAATQTLHELRSQAEAVGAGLVVTWCDQLLERAGLSPRGRTESDDALTAREQQVLDLVAEGLSNGQIAERLFISRKTVSVHVSAILRKTGAASRTEAVRLAAR